MQGAVFRILNSCISNSWSEAESSCLRWAYALTARGHNVTTIVPEGSRIGEELKRRRLNLVTLPGEGRWYDIGSRFKLRSLLKRHSIKIIQAHTTQDLKLLNFLRLGMKLPRILFAWHGENMRLSRKAVLDRFSLSGVSHVIVPSGFAKERFVDATSFKRERVSVVYDGFDASQYELVHHDRLKIREKLEIPRSHVMIGCRNWIGPDMGDLELIEAMRIVLRRFENAHLILIGEQRDSETAYLEALKAKVSEYGMDRIVTFVTELEEIALLSAIDIFVNPAYEDISGTYLIEAMLAGLPCIAADSGALSEILEKGRLGLLAEPRSVEGLAKALLTLIENEDLRADLASKAKAHAHERFRVALMLGALEKLYATRAG